MNDALWILIPTYNDWEALLLFLDTLGTQLANDGLTARVLVVDDGSTIAAPRGRAQAGIASVQVLRLRRNLGHQRAIAVGLCHLVDVERAQRIVVMDGDGEDQPADITRLVAAADSAPRSAVFAGRLRRSEGVWFTLFYHLYRTVHRVLTGISVRMGNFSYLPGAMAERLTVCSELWNHYAAAVVHSRTPFTMVPCDRGARLAGRSKMNAVSLVAHGLSAMAVFSDRIGVRALGASALALVGALVGLGVVLAVKWGTDLALPGWATSAAGLMVVLVTELVALCMIFTFVILAGRTQTTVIPLRDYKLFVAEVTSL